MVLTMWGYGGYAQNESKEFEVSGVVIESETKEPIELINIMVDSLKTGTVSNLEGAFVMKLPAGTWTLSIKAIGFDDFKYAITVKDSALTNLVLRVNRSTYTLAEDVVILPGENPANRIIKNAIKNKKRNRMENIEAWQCETYNKTSLTMDNISDKSIQKSLILRPARDFLNNHKNEVEVMDSNNKMKVGLFISETIADVYYTKPDKRKEMVKASHSSGNTNSESTYITNLISNVDIYENNLTILEKDFMGPLTDGALMNYRFYLFDTIVNGVDSIFGMHIVPRNKFDKVFKGEIWIENSSWAVKKVDMRMNADPNINLVEDIRIRQEFEKVDSFWVPRVRDVLVDFKNKSSNSGLIGRTITVYENWLINVPKDKKFYKNELMEITDEAYKRDSSYWRMNRKSTLERSDVLAYQLMDTLRKKRSLWNILVTISEFLTNGKKRIKWVELGPYSKLISFNRIEGIRLQVGGNTHWTFSKRFYVGAYCAYAFKDKRWKYDAEFRFKILLKPKLEIGMSRTDDIEQAGLSNYMEEGAGIMNSALMRVPLTKMNYFKENAIRIYSDVAKGVGAIITLRTRSFEPAFPFWFVNKNGSLQSKYRNSEIGGMFMFKFKEDYVIKRGERIYLGKGKYPTIFAEVNWGIKNVLKSNFNYFKANIAIIQKIRSSRFGWLNYTISAGYLMGAVPYPDLFVIEGNQSWTMDPCGFYSDHLNAVLNRKLRMYSYDRVSLNLAWFYEFVADKYVSVGLDHHFDGWLFRKIPGVRWVTSKIKIKEVFSFRMFWGQVSKANRVMNTPYVDDPNLASKMLRVNTADKIPYMEVGFGIENIFKFLRIDFIWRVTHRNHVHPANMPKDLFMHNFGIRLYANFSF